MNAMSIPVKHEVLTHYLIDNQAYVALFSDGTEISQPSYARQPINFVTPEEGQTSNSEEVLFPIAEEMWGSITDLKLYDSQTGGKLLFESPAQFVKTIDQSSQYRIPENFHIVRLV